MKSGMRDVRKSTKKSLKNVIHSLIESMSKTLRLSSVMRLEEQGLEIQKAATLIFPNLPLTEEQSLRIAREKIRRYLCLKLYQNC